MENDARGITEQVRQLQDGELDEILKALVHRYAELLPEHELVCLFLPKYDPAERMRIISQMEQLCFPQTE